MVVQIYAGDRDAWAGGDLSGFALWVTLRVTLGHVREQPHAYLCVKLVVIIHASLESGLSSTLCAQVLIYLMFGCTCRPQYGFGLLTVRLLLEAAAEWVVEGAAPETSRTTSATTMSRNTRVGASL